LPSSKNAPPLNANAVCDVTDFTPRADSGRAALWLVLGQTKLWLGPGRRFSAHAHLYHTAIILRPFFWDHPGEPVPEENFWTLLRKGRLTEADTATIQLGATPSGLTSAHLHHHLCTSLIGRKGSYLQDS